MPRFFLNLDECGTLCADEEGHYYPDLAAAREGALAAARWIMSEEIRDGRLCLSCSIVIMDDRGRHRDVVKFDDAVRTGHVGR